MPDCGFTFNRNEDEHKIIGYKPVKKPKGGSLTADEKIWNMGCSGNGTPLHPEGRERMSRDIQADVSSGGIVEGGRVLVCACICFAVGRRGACPSLPGVC